MNVTDAANNVNDAETNEMFDVIDSFVHVHNIKKFRIIVNTNSKYFVFQLSREEEEHYDKKHTDTGRTQRSYENNHISTEYVEFLLEHLFHYVQNLRNGKTTDNGGDDKICPMTCSCMEEFNHITS